MPRVRRSDGSERAPGRRPLRALVSLVLFPLLATCGGEPTAPTQPPPPPPPSVRYVDIIGPDVGYLGYPLTLRARVLSAAYDSLDRAVTWRSSDTSVATVSGGVVTTKRTGFITISATAEGVTDGHALRIAQMQVAQVVVTPRTDSLYPGDTVRLVAVLRDSAGGTIPDPRPITWSSSDTTKAVVDGDGLVRGDGAGSVAITVSAGGKTGGAFLTVQLPAVTLLMPDSVTLELHQAALLVPALRNAAGGQLGGRVTWSVSDATVASINAEGVLTPSAPGTTLVVAAADGLADTCRVTVVPEPMGELTINVLAGAIQPADSVVSVFSVTTRNTLGTDMPAVPVFWRVLDSTIAVAMPEPPAGRSVRFTVLQPGRTGVVATAGSFADTAVLTTYFPPVRLVAEPDSLSLPTGARATVTAHYYDKAGRLIAPGVIPQPASRSLDTMVVMERWPGLEGRFPGRTRIVVSYASLEDTVDAVVPPDTEPQLAWLLWDHRTSNWSRVSLTLTTRGFLPSVPLRFSSADTSVAVVLPAMTESVRAVETVTVYVRRPGSTVLTAEGAGAFATTSLVALPAPVTLQARIAPRPVALALGDSIRLAAYTGYGSTLPYPVRWESSAPATLRADPDGSLHALAEGPVTIRAVGLESADSIAVRVVGPGGPVLRAIGPQPLVAGDRAFINGTGFDTSPAANTVTINGVAAAVTHASDSSLDLLLAPQACAPTIRATVEVEVGGRYDADSAWVSSSTARNLFGNQWFESADANAACDEVVADGWPQQMYLVTVLNTDGDAGATRVVEVHGAGVSATGAPPSPVSPAQGPVTAVAGPAPARLPSRDSLRNAAAAHRRILEAGRVLATRAGDPVPLLRAARTAGPRRSVTSTINGVARIRVPRVDRPDLCATYTAIDARLVSVGAHVKVFEDVAAPLAGTMDAVFKAVADEFDAVTWPLLLAYFGDPTAMDSLLDGDGRVAMVFTPRVNAYGASGFVVSCDFYPEAVAPSSNTGEVIYAMVPTVAGSGYAYFTADAWRWQVRSVLAHEAKHVAAVAERLRRGLPLEETWLEEGSAVLAEEIWARTFSHVSWKSDANYLQTLWCEVRPGYPTCPDTPFSMYNTFAFLYDYLVDMPQHSPFGPTTPDDGTLYGSAWSLLRWVVDHYATTEAGFTRALTVSPVTGVANLAAQAGRPAGDLLGTWIVALWKDPASYPQGGLTEVLSWNHPNIFQGMRADYPNVFPASIPVWPTDAVSFGSFTTTLVIPGGGVGRFRLNAFPYGRDLLRVTGPGGAPAPSTIRLQVMRLN